MPRALAHQAPRFLPLRWVPRVGRLALWLLFGVFGLGPAHAQVVQAVISLQVTNAAPWILDSDASNPDPGWDRDGLSARIEVRSVNPSAAAASTAYTVVFRLLDDQSNVHPIFEAGGTTNAAATYFLVQNSFQVPARGNTARVHTAHIRPAARLDPFKLYRLEARIFQPGVVPPIDTALSVLRRYYHFVNTQSGDLALNVIVNATSLSVSRRGALATDPDKAGFEAVLNYGIRRYDAFAGSHLPADDVTVRFTYELQDADTGAVIPLVHGTSNVVVSVARHAPVVVGEPVEPEVSARQQVLTLLPAPGVQLDSVNHTYRVVARLAHQEFPNLPVFRAANEEQTGSERLLHFNGRLFFGNVETRIVDLNNSPGVSAVVPGNYVRSPIQIKPGGGSVVGQPTWTFGGGFPFNVLLRANGDAEFDGNVVALGGQLAPIKLTNVKVTYGNLQLNQAGLVGEVQAWLPAGFGYRTDTNTHVLRNRLVFPATSISATGVPTAATLEFTPSGGLQAVEESQPVWFPAKSITWRVGAGRFEVGPLTGPPQHVRSPEYQTLQSVALALAEPDAAVKRSNDRYFGAVTAATPPVIDADTNCVGRLSTTLTFGSGQFRAHFPWNTRLAWSGGGQTVIDQGATPSTDELTQFDTIQVSYARGCLDGNCPGDPQFSTVGLEPTNAVVRFTHEGGLAAIGHTQNPTRLQIGYIPSLDAYTHEAFTFSEAGFHMPGRRLRGGANGLEPAQRAGALLYSGVLAQAPKFPNTFEIRDLPGRPTEERYQKGWADYAGLNFRLIADGAAQGRSILGGTPTVDYPLQQNSKYYARHSGVSGIQQAAPGGFPPALQIYGYAFTLDRFAFNLLDNGLHESGIDGSIALPYPSDFTLTFDGLRFDCLGALHGADLAPGQPTKPLAYWNGSFAPQALNFERNGSQECDPNAGRLVLGVSTAIANVPGPLAGRLGFLPDGNLMSASDGLEGLDSRLSLETSVPMPGPTGETYYVIPVTSAYFNDYRQRPAEVPNEPGWVNFAGKIDASFFADLEAHFHTSANANQPEAFLDLMGGWVADPEHEANHGWIGATGENFFNQATFDASNRGYPTQITLAAYRDPTDTEAYRVRAQRTWQNIHTFEFPLDWSRASRTFRSPAPIKKNLVVLQTERQVERLSPKHTELTFGAQFEVLPQANLANIAAQIADHSGLSAALAEAIGITDRDRIVGGFTGMNELLDSSLETFFDRVFTESIDGALNDTYADLTQLYDGFDPNDPAGFAADLSNYGLTQLAPRLEVALKGIGGDLDKGIIHHLADYLEKAHDGLESAQKIVSKVSDKRTNIVNTVRKIIEHLAPQHATGLLPERLEELLERSEPTLQQLDEGCERLAGVLEQIQQHMLDLGSLQNPGGLGIEIKDVIGRGTNQIHSLALSVSGAIQEHLNAIIADHDSPFHDYTPDEIRDHMRQELMNRWLGSPVAADIRQVLKERLYENDAAAREILDSIFSEVNRIIRGLIKLSASGVASQFEGLSDDMGQNVLSTDIDGYAHIAGDSLQELRLDGRFKMNIFDSLEFGAYLRIRELDSEGTRTCNADLVGATEVVLGAKDVGIGWIQSGLKASVEQKFTFGTGDGFPVRGLGGGFQLIGDMQFDEVTVERLAGAVAFGKDENYLSGGADLKVSGWKFSGGLFGGRTCTLSPIEIFDPKAAGALGNPPFTGLYYYAEGWVPLNELLGVKSSCLLTLSGGMGIGRGIFLEGPTVLAKVKYGLSGEFLCLVHLQGELTGVASLKLFNPFEGAGESGYAAGLLDKVRDGLTLRAFGKFTGSLGPCPLCLDYTKEIGATYKAGKWKLEK